MNVPKFCIPLDGEIGKLAADHVPGSYSILLDDASRIVAANVSVDNPIRLTVLSPDGLSFCQFRASSPPINNQLTVSVEPGSGYQDVSLPAGSTVEVTASASAFRDIHSAIADAIGAINTVELTPGPKGDTGSQGVQGPKGDKGDPGIQGIQGPKGDTGAQGIQGPQGIQGLKGDKGDTGPAGPAGSASAPGSNGQLPYTLNGQFAASSIVTDGGSVIQFQAGDIAFVQNTGKCLKLSQAGDQYGPTSLELMNRNGVNGARFTCEIWLVDFVFLAAQTGVQSNLRFNTDNTILPGNLTAGGGEFVFYMNTGGSSPQFAAQIGAGASKFHSPTTFVPDSTAGVPVTVQAAPGQALPLIEARDVAGNPLMVITKNGGLKLAQMTDSDAENGTLYYSTTIGKPAFKDNSGIVTTLS